MKMAITAMYIIILPKSIVNDSLNKCYDFRYILCYPGQTVSRKDLDCKNNRSGESQKDSHMTHISRGCGQNNHSLPDFPLC